MPHAWPMVPLGDLLKQTQRREVVESAKIYDILGTHWYAKGLYTKYTKLGSDIRARSVNRVKQGDFVYNRLFAWKGSFAIATQENNGCYVSNEFPCFVVNAERLDGQYLWHYFSRAAAWNEALGLSSGGTPTSRNRLKEAKLLAMCIPLPPLDEQLRIVARINELATLIQEAQSLRAQALEESKALASSALSQMFDYQVNDMLPDGWAWHSLNELLIDSREGMKTGPFGTLLQKSEIQSEGVPILGIVNVQANRFVPGFADYVTTQKASELSSYELQEGDIVVARSGTVGRSCIVPSGLDPVPIMSTNLIRLRLNTRAFLPELLCRLFNGSRLIEHHKESECRGSTRSFFTQRILSKLRIPVPPLPEQHRIVVYLHELQAKAAELTALQDATQVELDALLPSVLDCAFKGEL
jgi:type I restriction enzyme S subunit